MFRREEHYDIEAKRRGKDAAILTCGTDVTPDFIHSCAYTDCFRSDSNAPDYLKGGVPHAGLSRRRMGATGPFSGHDGKPGWKKEWECPINPTAPNADGKTPAKAKDCPPGDSRASEPILGVTLGNHVCSYKTATPYAKGVALKATENALKVSDTDVKCQCKTVRCKVITKDDDTVDKNGANQKAGQTACNFIVRIEDTHAVPSVPNWIMWVIFGLALVVAAVTSAFFICLYGSKAHNPDGGEDSGSNE